MKCFRIISLFAWALLVGAPAARALDNLIITEFLAVNDGPLADENGEFSDWIEIYNADTNTINLGGWYLTGDTNNLMQWKFPALDLPPNGYQIVFASNKDRRVAGSPLHTNFRLSGEGEYLALVKPDGVTVAFAYAPLFPIQVAGVSYGLPVQQSTTTLITNGTAARVLIPTDGSLEANWTHLDLDASSWLAATNGVGFETDGQSAFTPTVIADSVAEFSGVQGQNNWSYGYWNRKTDADGIYNAGTEFVAFPNDGGAHGVGNYWNGTSWDWFNGNPPHTEITSTGGLPAGNNGNPAAESHWAIRRYICESNGPVKITGTITHTSDWIYVTATGVAANSALYVYLTAVGEGYIDDIKLVAGSVPEAGANLIANGDFEGGAIAPWVVGANHAGSSVSSAVAHTGTRSLRMVTTEGGTTLASSISQTITPALAVSSTYTISYWFLPSANYSPLVVRFSGNWINTSPAVCGDGTLAKILVDGVQVYQRAAYGNSVNYSIIAQANAGSLIDFIIDPGAANNDNCDATTFTASVQTQDPTVGTLADTIADWSGTGTQGEKNWFYGYYNRTADTFAGYQTTNFVQFPRDNGPFGSLNYWTGTGWNWFAGDPPWDQIDQTFMHPNGINNSAEHWVIRRWIAESSGNLTVEWNLAKAGAGGSGVTGRIFQNGVQRDTVTIGGSDLLGVVRTIVLTNVIAGQAIDFALDPTGVGAATDDGSDGSFMSATIRGTASLNGQFATDLAGVMKDVSSTAYIRIPFTVSDPAVVSFLNLRMKYDDGFIAYLNGQPVANRNAPISPGFASAATAAQADADAVQFEDFDLTSYTGLLQAGANVLAIHGLNRSAGDSDFLSLAQLRAVSVVTDPGSLRYFAVATPGTNNGFGSTNLGPVIREVQHTPEVPKDNEDLIVTAKVAATFNPITAVRLTYRVMFGAEVTVPMLDDGAHGDGALGDGVFGAGIPAAASVPGQMVRYFVTTTDTRTNQTRFPTFLQALASPQYLGTVVYLPQTNNLPVLHWFIESPTAANTSAGGRGAIFFKDQFRDNVKAFLHGQSSSGFNTLKKSYNIDLNPGERMRIIEGAPKVDDINLLTTYADKSHLRNMINYGTYTDSGTPSHFAFAVRVQQNGTFFAVYNIVENGDDNYLQRIGYDQNGALYKMYNSAENTSGVEKKTRRFENNNDLQLLINGSSTGTADARKNYIHDNMDIPGVVNFLAVKAITSDHDCCHKNYYFYRDTLGSGEWTALAWDADLSLGRIWSSGPTYFDDVNYTNASWNVGGNTVMATIFNTPSTLQMYQRRIRTLADQFLGPAGTTNGYYEQRIEYQKGLIGPDAALDFAKWATWGVPMTATQNANQIITNYLPGRRAYVTHTRGVGGTGEIPLSQPATTVVQIAAIDFNPSSGNQQQEYICLTNRNTYAVDVSGWKLAGGVSFTFKGGTVIPANTALYVVANKVAFRARTSGPRGGLGQIIVGPYEGQLSARGETLYLTNFAGVAVTTNTFIGSPSPAQEHLKITEVMYHPPAAPLGSPFDTEEFEYLELRNTGPGTLDLRGVRLTTGVEFAFTGSAVTNLGAGESVLVVRNVAAFTSRYGGGLPVAGAFTGILDNAGERLELFDAVGEKILDFAYDNQWYPTTDGPGASLVIRNDLAHWSTWDFAESWRPSAIDFGSPGATDPATNAYVAVIINEVFTHTDLPLVDAIEILNPTEQTADLSGWFLSDDFATAKKFRIPDGTVLAPGAFVVFTEGDFNPTPGVDSSFSLRSAGDEAYVFSGNGTNITGYVHGHTFGAGENGVTFGRYTNSQGAVHFVAQSARTLGTNNARPKVGPVIVSEIMYHPPDLPEVGDNTVDEFVELANLSGDAVPLYDPVLPANPWQLRGAVDFAFPAGASLPAGGFLMVVSFDPTNTVLATAFRAKYGVAGGVPLHGPYSGKLDNSTDTIELLKPDAPGTNGVPYILADAVTYADDTPWPVAADALGGSLQRIVQGDYGDDATNWVAAAPSGGQAFSGGQLPAVTSAPTNTFTVAGGSASFSVAVSGTPPFTYQWQFNSNSIPGANSATLQLNNVQLHQAGAYRVIIFSAAGSIQSGNATLAVLIPASITQHPSTVQLRVPPDPTANPTNRVATFTCAATTLNPPLTYQWRFNGADLPGRTNASLSLSNVVLEHEGQYDCAVTDFLGTIYTAPARLIALVTPTFVVRPVGQVAAAGGTFTHTAVIAGNPPPFGYRWNSNSVLVSFQVSTSRTHIITFPAMPWATNASAQFRLIVTNQASPGNSVNALLTNFTLVDFDQDGLPDVYETALGLSTNNPADALGDLDGDGASNADEYRAGTDATNPASYLRVELDAMTGIADIVVAAVTNRSYTVQYSDQMPAVTWTKLADILGRTTNRLETNRDPAWVPSRYYRVVLPAQP